jgi:DNA-binding transcriptional LysR family regulator
MTRKIDWEAQIGRRLKLRDLHVLLTVAKRGSMAKAAAELGVSQPAVSEVIADLEHALGVRLLDRSPHGVEPTAYGRALLKRSVVAFDELKQGIREIEYLADPTMGEVRIGCVESLACSILPPVIESFSRQYPRVGFRLDQAVAPSLDLPELRERSLDMFLTRVSRPVSDFSDELNVEIIFHDELFVVAGMQSPWSRRRRVDLAELVNERWLIGPPNSWNDLVLQDTFRARGLTMPKAFLTTFSIHFRANLLAAGPFVSALPGSMIRLNAERFSLKVLPVDLPRRPWPVAIITLKNRTLSPVVGCFIEQIRAFTRAMARDLDREQKSA